MYKILISGYYGFNNIGDEAVLRTVIDNLRNNMDDIDITILSQNPEDTREKYGVHAQPRMSLPKIIKAVKSCDMLISGGGSLLQDTTSKISILYYLFIIRLALLFKKKVFIYSQGIGPINSSFNRALTARFLKRVDGIAVRDEKSAQFLQQIGIPGESINVTADPVLRLEKAELSSGRKILDNIGCTKEPGCLTVGWAIKASDSPSAADGSDFIGEIERSVRWLHSKYGAKCVLIPFHYEQDAKVIKELSDRLGDEVYCITDKHLSDEMLSIIGNLDILVGVRLHSLIYASVMDVPSIGISYDPKIDAFLDSISQHAVSDVSSFTLDKFQSAFEHTLENRDQIVAETASHVSNLITRLDRNDAMVKEISRSPKSERKKGGIASAIGGVMLVTILAKVFGILRESIQANVFGAADAFYDSYNKTIYLFTTAAYAMCVAAVPIITKEMAISRKRGERAANNLTTFSFIIGLIGLGIWEICTLPPISGLVFGSADSQVLSYIRIMALSLPIIIAAYLMVSVFQSMDHFALQGSMALPYSVFLIAYLALFGREDSLYTYVILVCAAWLLQFAMCLPYMFKEHYLYRPVLDIKQGYIKVFIKTSIVTIITSSMYLFCYLIDSSRASMLGEGTTSAFYYADKIFTPLTTTFIYSISAVMFPKFNREYAKSGEREYKGYVWSITSGTLIAVFPVCALLIVFGEPIIKVLFESGNFTSQSTAATAEIFVMYALGMAGFSIIDLLNKAFYTMNKSLVPLIISLGIIAMNFVTDIIFNISGALLALSTSVSMTVGAVVTIVIMFRGSKIVNLAPVVKSLASSCAIGVVAYELKNLLVFSTDGKIMLVLKCGVIGVVSLALFMVLCLLLKIEPVSDIIKGKLKKS